MNGEPTLAFGAFSKSSRSSNDCLSSNSNSDLLKNLEDDFEVSVNYEFNQPTTSIALDFIIKTRKVIEDYGKLCAKCVNLNQFQEVFLKPDEFLDFESEDEEITFSSEDYIETMPTGTKEEKASNNNKIRHFNQSSSKITFDFNQNDPKKKLNFINSSLRKMFNRLLVLNNGRGDSKKIHKVRVFACFCGRKFDDGRKLGGHMSKFHKNTNNL